MRKLLFLLVLGPGLLLAQSSVSGRWITAADFYGTPLYLRAGADSAR